MNSRCHTPGCARSPGHDGPCVIISLAPAHSAEPTMAEAFERVRDGLSLIREDKHPATARRALAALSLLERRMIELERSTTKEKHMDHDEARALMEGTVTPPAPEHPPEPEEAPSPFEQGPDRE